MPKLTKIIVEKLVPVKGKQIILRDSELIGFGFRCCGKVKSFIVETRINGINKRMAIGTYPELSFDEARLLAQKIIGDIKFGIDPYSPKTADDVGNLTLQEAFDDYIANRKVNAQTAQKYRSVIEVHLRDWCQLPIRDITREMVVTRFEELIGPTRCKSYSQKLCFEYLKKVAYSFNR